jgi:hypothetical protein
MNIVDILLVATVVVPEAGAPTIPEPKPVARSCKRI